MSFTQNSHSCSQRMKSSLEQRPGTWRGLAIVVQDPGYPCSIDYHTLPLLVPLSLVEKSLAEKDSQNSCMRTQKIDKANYSITIINYAEY